MVVCRNLFRSPFAFLCSPFSFRFPYVCKDLPFVPIHVTLHINFTIFPLLSFLLHRVFIASCTLSHQLLNALARGTSQSPFFIDSSSKTSSFLFRVRIATLLSTSPTHQPVISPFCWRAVSRLRSGVIGWSLKLEAFTTLGSKSSWMSSVQTLLPRQIV